jgi:ribokinase
MSHAYAAYASSLHPSVPSNDPSKKPLVVVGSVNADLVVRLKRLPKKGETVSAADSMQFYPGGKGANQAVAASNLGHPTQFVGQVGQDVYAPLLCDALQSRGVDTSMVHAVPSCSSGIAFIMVQPDGENSIVIVGGANTSEEWQITDDVTSAIQSAGVVLLQREIPESVNVVFAKLACSARVPVILDAGGADAPLSSDILANVTILSPNETELHRLTGLPTKTEKECISAAQTLVHQGVNKVLVKLGAKGSVLVDIYGNVVRQKACQVLPSSVVDTTGAGDCFTAAFAVAMLEGKSDQEAMAWASKAASLCIQSRGAIPSMPTRAMVMKC